jgi:3-oxoacyl-[acyl-carrier protein] reductase
MSTLNGRVAVVTGAAQGIGQAILERFAREGAAVVGLDRNEDALAEAVEKVTSAGGRALAVPCDVTSREQVEAAMAGAEGEFGTLDILVNNAGVTRDALLHKMTDEEFDTVIGIHLKGSFLCTQIAQRYMVQRRYGKIVMLSSRAALGNRGQTNYSAAKAGLQGMTRTLAMELGPFGINVNAIAPGHIETAMTRAVAERVGLSYEDLKEKTIAQNAIKRVGRPEDIAHLAAFLVSDESSFITGQTIYVAGRPTV